MQLATIVQLNQLNQKFYQTTAQQFSDSRNYYWQGWYELMPIIQSFNPDKKIKVLDIACGNARFAEFLVKEAKINKLEYYGLDNNNQLLTIAQKKLTQLHISHHLNKLDLVKTLIKTYFCQQQIHNFDLITGFGILHHIPSFELRQKLFQNANLLLNDHAFFIVTSWQFIQEEKFNKKIIEPKQVELNPDELEEHDYILDWQRGVTAYRYCHYTSEKEINQLAKVSKLKLLNNFQADGQSGQLNLYSILKK